METGRVRQFIKVSDGRIGVVMANEMAGGVYRGHCDLWFGQFKKDGSPIIEQLCINENWTTVACPLGMTKRELEKE